MTLFPEIQKRAQVEIDAVVGNDRLPSFSDRNQLPYVEALMKEVLRWNIVASMTVSSLLRRSIVFQPFPTVRRKLTSRTGT